MLDTLPDWRLTGTVAVFGLVYLGMFLGGLPRLRLDRTGVAVLGGIAVMALQGWTVNDAVATLDLKTLALLFSFMVLSAQMRLAGFYAGVTRAVGQSRLSPPSLLAVMLIVVALLSAVFSNDIVCLAVTPVVIRMAWRRGWDPVPWLLGVACAANIGSAATLIGNPQNMLIGSVMGIPFGRYVQSVLAPVLLALAALWSLLAWRLQRSVLASPDGTVAPGPLDDGAPTFDRWQAAKGLLVAAGLLLAFLLVPWPYEVAALVAAGLLLLSRRFHSSQVMALVDWPLLLLFAGLFMVNGAFQATGLADRAFDWLAAQGLSLSEPAVLAGAGLVLSNLVSNVPAVMLLLPHLDSLTQGITLALASTYAGNLLLVGSIANLIVADLARRDGVQLDWRRHAAVGIPITLLSLLTWALWEGVLLALKAA